MIATAHVTHLNGIVGALLLEESVWVLLKRDLGQRGALVASRLVEELALAKFGVLNVAAVDGLLGGGACSVRAHSLNRPQRQIVEGTFLFVLARCRVQNIVPLLVGQLLLLLLLLLRLRVHSVRLPIRVLLVVWLLLARILMTVAKVLALLALAHFEVGTAHVLLVARHVAHDLLLQVLRTRRIVLTQRSIVDQVFFAFTRFEPSNVLVVRRTVLGLMLALVESVPAVGPPG